MNCFTTMSIFENMFTWHLIPRDLLKNTVRPENLLASRVPAYHYYSTFYRIDSTYGLSKVTPLLTM